MHNFYRSAVDKFLWTLKVSEKLRWMSDESYLKLIYFLRCRKTLHLDKPRTFTEKLQWLKINNRKPQFTTMVDKYRAKQFISEKVGEEHVVPSYGCWKKADDIDWNALPDKFVLKTNHDSGTVLICSDKKSFDANRAKSILQGKVEKNFYAGGREWPYKDVDPLIFAEQYLEDAELENDSGDEWCGIAEYDFFCFDGKPKFVSFCHGDKTDSSKRFNDYYDMDFVKMNLTCGYSSCGHNHDKPKQFSEMVSIAKELSDGIPFLRVDMFICNDVVYVGEMTFFPWSGFMPFEPYEKDLEIAEMINVSREG